MSVSFADAFKDKSVFVTGHTGFKGSWLCLWLSRLGARVTGYALAPPTEPNNFTVTGVRDLLSGHHEADVRDAATLHAAMLKAEPDVILHLAAQSIVKEGYASPRETFDTNVMGTVSLLDGVRKLDGPCVVVVVTSDKCYENREQVWGYRESDPLGDHDPYGGSKGAAEIVVRTYRHSFLPPARREEHGIKLASARAGNVIGGGDWTADALVVDLVRALSRGVPVQLRNPGACRPWQHVLQALSGYLTVAARLLESDDPALQSGWNIGPLPGNEISVREVVERFIAEWGEGSWVDAGDPSQPREANILRLAIDKALWQLDWRPRWTIDEVLRYTARWYRQHFEEQGSMRSLCLEQVAAYEAAPSLATAGTGA
jgi:CDP-glucose 4,6-dehydratase